MDTEKQVGGAASASPRTAGSAFRGVTYIYPTPNDGPREIGVITGLGDTWIVAWIADSGAKRRVKTHHLPAGISPDELQAKLDAWAAARRIPQNVPVRRAASASPPVAGSQSSSKGGAA